MSTDPNRQVIVITGGTRGIGRAIAEQVARSDRLVIVTGRSDGSETVAAITKKGFAGQFMQLDITDEQAVGQCFDTIKGEFGGCDILINNAGTNRPKTMAETSAEDYDAIMGLNVRAAYFVDKAVTDGLIAVGRPGSIVHISSQMGHVGGPRRTVYCASKFAIEGLTKAMAMEFAPHDIRVNSIGPTFIDTPLARASIEDPEMNAYIMSKIKLGRIGRVEDLMGAIVFLASDAAAMITGAALLIDGGWTIG